jgi:hypothetical protein
LREDVHVLGGRDPERASKEEEREKRDERKPERDQ